MDVMKAIIPAAGLGTRFLPITKAVPKEMLPILNKPALHYIIEESLASHVSHFLVVTSSSKHAIADYFDPLPSLDSKLEDTYKADKISALNKIIRSAQFTYVRQPEPLGLGHAISMARNLIGKEYFAVLLPDDIIINKTPGISQLIKIARQEKASVVAVQEVPMNAVSSYGVISVKKHITPNLFQVGHIVEKPSQKDAPSNLAVVGRYILSHKIFDALDAIAPYSTGEIQLTDAITRMMDNNEKVIAVKIQGQRFDIGSPAGWLKANLHLALQDPELAPQLKDMLLNPDQIDLLAYSKPAVLSHSSLL